MKPQREPILFWYCTGNVQLAENSLPRAVPPEVPPPLRISQRMKLETSQLDGVDKRIQVRVRILQHVEWSFVIFSFLFVVLLVIKITFDNFFCRLNFTNKDRGSICVDICVDKCVSFSRINPFHATDLFWYPLKTSESLCLFCLRGYQKRSVAWKGLTLQPKSENLEFSASRSIPANIYLFKVNKTYTIKRCEIVQKLTIKTPEWRHWLPSDVFIC